MSLGSVLGWLVCGPAWVVSLRFGPVVPLSFHLLRLLRLLPSHPSIHPLALFDFPANKRGLLLNFRLAASLAPDQSLVWSGLVWSGQTAANLLVLLLLPRIVLLPLTQPRDPMIVFRSPPPISSIFDFYYYFIILLCSCYLCYCCC